MRACLRKTVGSPKIRDLLRIHDRHSPAHSLPEVIGDGYLYANNPIFREIRKRALRSGYRFVLRPASPYFTAPLFSLPLILATKSIPFRDNVGWIRKLEKSQPGFLEARDLEGLLANPTAHEAAHCVAHSGLNGKSLVKNNPTQQAVLKCLLEESYANAVEQMAGLFNEDCPESQWFWTKNSHLSGSSLRGLHVSIQEFGDENAFLLGWMFYLYSNFLLTRVGVRENKRIFDFLGLSKQSLSRSSVRNAVSSIASVTLKLNPRFRFVATRGYFRRLGFTQPLHELVRFDPLEAMSSGGEDCAATLRALCPAKTF